MIAINVIRNLALQRGSPSSILFSDLPSFSKSAMSDINCHSAFSYRITVLCIPHGSSTHTLFIAAPHPKNPDPKTACIPKRKQTIHIPFHERSFPSTNCRLEKDTSHISSDLVSQFEVHHTPRKLRHKGDHPTNFHPHSQTRSLLPRHIFPIRQNTSLDNTMNNSRKDRLSPASYNPVSILRRRNEDLESEELKRDSCIERQDCDDDSLVFGQWEMDVDWSVGLENH